MQYTFLTYGRLSEGFEKFILETYPDITVHRAKDRDEVRDRAMTLAHRLRERGASVTYALRGQGVRKQFRSAESEGAREVVVLGPDELAQEVADAGGTWTVAPKSGRRGTSQR